MILSLACSAASLLYSIPISAAHGMQRQESGHVHICMYIFTYVESLLSARASHTHLLNGRVEAITHCVRLQSANGFLWGQEGVEKLRCTLNKPAESKHVSHLTGWEDEKLGSLFRP